MKGVKKMNNITNRLFTAVRVLLSPDNIVIHIKDDGTLWKVDWGGVDMAKQDKQAVATKFFKAAYNL